MNDFDILRTASVGAQRADAQLARASTTREGEHFLERDQEQLSRWTSLMRRVEDLADRISGPQPTAPVSDQAKPMQGPGFIGVMFDLQRTRDEVGERLSIAIDRIERVL